MGPKSMIFISSYLLALISSVSGMNSGGGGGDGGGFTTELIHRDSPDSPLYDPSSTHSNLLTNAIERSRLRAKFLNDSIKAAAEATITSAGGEFLMRFSIGSSREVIFAVVDTGSHLTWTQCLPCNSCIRQRLPIFDPQTSSSYRGVQCGTYACGAFYPTSACDRRGSNCIYAVGYGDGSYSNGVVATETFYFWSTAGKSLRFDDVVFGCGHNNSFTHLLKGSASGVVGLAGGRSSLVRQLGFYKFAYCLTPYGDPGKLGKLHFGDDAVVSGGGTVATPLSRREQFYYLTLEAISVRNQTIKFHKPYAVWGGNIAIDSGSMLTFVPADFYEELVAAVTRSIAARGERDSAHRLLCYRSEFVMPEIRVHFKGGADLEWGFENAFYRVNDKYVCLAVEPTNGLPLYGNIAQANYMVGYDLQGETVSFKPTRC